MAEQLLNEIEEKLDEGEITIWGEILKLIRGPLTFRHWSNSDVPCPVIDVYLVLGGVYGSEAHYRIQPSNSNNGTYHYIHRLSYYHLNASTFRDMMERALMKVLTALKHTGANIRVTSTDVAVELTCCRNGMSDPDWRIRLMPAIEGEGEPPRPIESHRRPWLIVPPPRVSGPYTNTWEVRYLSDIWRGSSVMDKAAVCVVYEAESGLWGDGKIDFDRLLNRLIIDIGDVKCDSLSGKFEFLVTMLMERLEERREDDYIPDDVIDDVISKMKLSINGDLEVKVRNIEENINRFLPRNDISDDGARVDETLDEIPRDLAARVDETFHEIQRDFTDMAARVDETFHEIPRDFSDLAARLEENGTKKANGTVPNGTCNGVRKSDKKSKNETERARKRYFTIFSICLVLVVIGFIFVVTWLDDGDVIKLMYDGKFNGLNDNSKEF